MSRGFIITLIVLGVVVLAILFLPLRHTGHPVSNAVLCRRDVKMLAIGLADYRFYYDSFPTGNQAEVVKALLGTNPRQIVFMAAPYRKNSTNSFGEFLDPWGTPYEISVVSTNDIHIRSAGPNHQFGDIDDIHCEGSTANNAKWISEPSPLLSPVGN
jgi:hypothetical protein